ncbi:acyltransferase [Actinobacteria bacterium IMCC26103]|nr:acyltransferase [Actinobacteria bacterium IMCC26103]
MSSKPKIHQIQALRALAALLVVLFHAKLSPGGFIGVDVFYVISGYLITGLIIKEINLKNSFDYRAFYLRRAKRLLPASLGVLALTALAAWLVLPPTVRGALGKDILAASLYVSNYLFAWWQNDYQNLNATPSPVIHYWSLAVEEQFYIFWPILVFTLWRIGRQKLVAVGIAVTTLLSFALSLFLTVVNPIWAFYSLPTRAWELGIGALILFIPDSFNIRSTLVKTLSVWFGLIALAFSVFAFSERTAFPGYNALAPTVGAALMIAGIAFWPPILNDLSKLRLVKWLGEISYPFYLWHWPLLVLPSTRFGRPLTLLERIFFILLTALAADLTHRFLEKPIAARPLTARQIFRSSVTATALCSLAALAILSTDNSSITLKNGKSISIATVMQKPQVYLDDCHVNNGEVKSGKCTYGDRNSSKTIVLYGDSHAAQWFPALEKLANEQSFKLVSLTKSACPAPEVKKVQIGAYKNSDCFKWRANTLKRIHELKPEAVILSGYQHFDVPDGQGSRQKWWAHGQLTTYAHLFGASKNLIYISDTPHPTRDIPNCLASKGGAKCDDSEKSDPAIAGNFTKVNPTPWLCTATCPAVVNGVIAYRDASHISVEMSRSLALEIQGVLTDLGIL